jgi:serine/threonine protein kinase
MGMGRVVEGTPFGRYRLLARLGRGGMGEVWRAFDTDTNRVVAVKLLTDNLANDPQFARRFRREANAAAGLNDPHVVPIHHFGAIDGRLYVDMRLIEGPDLYRVLANGPMHPARAVAIIDQVASALNAAHRIGLVHRDVKPSNILIGERDFAYLIDFGIARATSDTGLTNTGAVVGSWAYLAPERISGQSDHRADIYALTCVLHECLTGQKPFPGNIEQQIGGHLGLPPPRPSAVLATVPTSFDEVVAKGMAKDPNHRYANVIELAHAARAATIAPTAEPTFYAQPGYHQHIPRGVSPPASAQQPEATAPTKRSPMRRPGIFIPAILAAVLLVAGTIFAATHLGGVSSPSTSTAVRPPPPPVVAPPADPPKPAGPTFEGTFTADYGPRTELGGVPIDGRIAPARWVVRSVCDRSGCVAAAATVGRPEGVLSRIFDFVDGRWVSVTEEPGSNPCTNEAGQRWEWTMLEPHPDGSLVGEFSSSYDNADCTSRSPVTYTRTADADPDVQTADLGNIAARVVSPARGLRGRYHSVTTYRSSGKTALEANYVGETFCLRAGDRCASILIEAPRGHFMVFEAGQWTEISKKEGKCDDGSPQHNEARLVLTLPQAPQDPIQALSGYADGKTTGGCSVEASFDWTLTRTGD